MKDTTLLLLLGLTVGGMVILTAINEAPKMLAALERIEMMSATNANIKPPSQIHITPPRMMHQKGWL